jgi:hypothetical protein
MMTRRFFLRAGALAAAALAFGKDMFAQARPTAQPLTIAQLIALSFGEVRKSWLEHERKEAPELWALRQSGQLTTRTLGAIVLCPVETADGQFHTDHYYPEAVSCPVMWTLDDEKRCGTELQKIDFVAMRLRNAFEAHAADLVDHIGPHRAVLSTEYSFERGEIHELPNMRAYAMPFFSGICVLDPAKATRQA